MREKEKQSIDQRENEPERKREGESTEKERDGTREYRERVHDREK